MSLLRSEIQDIPLDGGSLTLGDSAYVSPSASLTEPPIPDSSTYQPGGLGSPRAPLKLPVNHQSSPQTRPPLSSPPSPPPSEAWNYDHYIEQPRAYPHYVRPQDSNSSSGEHRNAGFQVREEDLESGRNVAVDPYTSLGLAPTLLASLSYFFLWLGGLVVLLLEKKNLFVLFHAWQSLVSGTIAFIIQFVFIWSETMYSLLWLVYLVFTFAMVVKVLNDAPSQRLFKLPYIGTWCEHRAINKIHYHSGVGNSSYRS